jgi:hypothetical protein
MLGHDFTAFYSAGHFAGLGQFERLYDVEAIKQFEQQTGRAAGLSLRDAYGPYWNPPFYAWVFVPLARLPYGTALLVWTLVNLACLIAAVVLLCRMLGSSATWRGRGLVPLLVMCSMPCVQALNHGQNTCTSLLLLAATVTLWRSGRALAAGMVAGLLFYKPQLGAVVAMALVLTLGWRALLGLSIMGAALLLVTITTMPGALSAFITQLPHNVRFMQIAHAYVWERHATIKAFWRLLFQGRAAGQPLVIVNVLFGVCWMALAGGLGWMLWRRRDGSSRDRIISATIAAMPLLMPFYFDYDLLLLAIPATLVAAEHFSNLKFQIPDRNSPWLIRAWVALYAWMLVNPGLAARTRVNLTVPLLAVLASMLIARAMPRRNDRPAAAAPAEPLDVTLPSRLAA